MSLWHYADESRQQRGPIEEIELRRLFEMRQVEPSTLIWREGMLQWQALGDLAEELGIVLPPADENAEALFAPLPQDRPALTESEQAQAWHASPHTPETPATPAFPGSDADTGAAVDAAGADAESVDASPYAAPHAVVAIGRRAVAGGEVVYAGFWKRAAAFLIDNFILTVIGSIVGGIAGTVLALLIGSNGDMGIAGIVMVQGTSYGVQTLIFASYFAWFHASTHQATPGKMAIGIKVTRGDGEIIGFWRGVGRYFASFLSTLLLGVGYFITPFTRRKQALHDLMCDTLVVDKWAYTHFPERQRRELGVVTWVVLILGGLLALFMLVALGALVGMITALGR